MKEKQLTPKKLKIISDQLRCPNGEMGIEMAERMDSSNRRMTEDSIDLCAIRRGDIVLELGHGNCGHLAQILKQADEVRYVGLEVSETMHREAERMNAHSLTNGQAAFRLYDGRTIPFPDNYFDRGLSVNTVYFWEDPEALLQEIARVLRPGATFVLAYAQKEFMRQLPFVDANFRLYDDADICALVSGSELDLEDVRGRAEVVESKTGERVTRPYALARLTLPR